MSINFNFNNCHAINVGGKRKGLQCGNPKGGLAVTEDKRFLCGNHLAMWSDDPDCIQFVPLPAKQGSLEDNGLDITHIPAGPSPAHRIVGTKGTKEARDNLNTVLQEGGLVAKAYLDKEDHMPEGSAALGHPPEPEPTTIVLDKEEDYFIVGSGTRSIWGDGDKMKQIHDNLVEVLLRAKDVHGDNLVVMAGGATGFDYVIARAAITAEVRLQLAIPNETYISYYWNKQAHHMDKLIEYAEKVVYVTGRRYGAKSNFDRNKYMVDRADQVWVYDKTSRGTSHAYDYAVKKGVRIWLVPVIS
jgi:uncharacterized phage-like protein YoqJ